MRLFVFTLSPLKNPTELPSLLNVVHDAHLPRPLRRTSYVPRPAPYSPLTFSPTGLHTSARRHALSRFAMPAMSPTMTEGGIASWKKSEGESFSVGDVLLEIVRASLSPSARVPSHTFYRRQTRPPLTLKLRMTVSSPKLSYAIPSPLVFLIYSLSRPQTAPKILPWAPQ